MEYSWETSLHEGDVEDFLRIKTPQWSRGEVLEEQVPLMEDMVSYVKKWRNSYLSNKSSTSIKRAKNDETKQSINQSINNLDLMSIFSKS